MFTPLHRWLGREPEDVSVALLDAAVEAAVGEKADLDFKLTPPPSRHLAESDIVKDIAAMANSGGGMIVFGVRDVGSRATEAPGVTEDFTTDTYVRDLRRVALNRISPPVLGLKPLTFSDGSRHGLAVIVPETGEAPHLIFSGDSFRAPYRNGPDTAWMDERMIEAAYRSRFEGRRVRDEDLHGILSQAVEGRPIDTQAWMAAAARPVTTPPHRRRLERAEATKILDGAFTLSDRWVRLKVHPLEWLDRSNPRPGLRRWVARFGRQSGPAQWREAQAQIFDDGTVTLVSAMGGGRGGAATTFGPSEFGSDRVETFLADFMAMLRMAGAHLGIPYYQVRIDILNEGPSQIIMRIPDSHLGGYYLDEEHSTPLHRFTPVETLVDTTAELPAFVDQVRDIALDVVNQGGAQHLHSVVGAETALDG